MSSSHNTPTSLQPLDVAVIGAGVIGIQVDLGLTNRNIRVTLYEQATELKELSAGFGFPDNIVECMRYLDPRLADAIIKTGIRSEGTHRWVDGMTKSDLRLMRDEDIPGISLTSNVGLYYCHRGQLMSEMVQLFPSDQIQLGKRLDTIENVMDGKKAILKFCDGTTAQADIGKLHTFDEMPLIDRCSC